MLPFERETSAASANTPPCSGERLIVLASRRDLRMLKAAQTIATNLSDMRGHVSLGTKAAMTRQSLDLLRQRYVIEKNL
jgi:hypothetical protein